MNMTIAEMMKEYNYTQEELYSLLCQKVYEQLKKDTGKKCVTFTLHEGESDVLASKIGGVPFIPQGGEYPVDTEEGEKLYLLIQLNFAEIPHMENYPESGILQIFISDEDCYGMNWDDPQCQGYWRVLYHEDISNPMSLADAKKLTPEVREDSFGLPFETPGQEFTLEFKEEVMPITSEDYRFDFVKEKAVQNLLPDEFKGNDLFDLPEELGDKLYEMLNGLSSHLGGYPGFTQSDIREGEKFEDYELFLQIDSEDEDGECYLMWGDCGVANFFIHPDDLKKRDFSKVVYNWDCC